MDGLTWQGYETDLHGAVEDCTHGGHIRTQPSCRRYIPKADGRQRPHALAVLEEGTARRAAVPVLNAMYEGAPRLQALSISHLPRVGEPPRRRSHGNFWLTSGPT